MESRSCRKALFVINDKRIVINDNSFIMINELSLMTIHLSLMINSAFLRERLSIVINILRWNLQALKYGLY